MNIDVSVDYEFDGFMHLYEGTFDPANAATCLAGTDDDTGTLTTQIGPGETLSVVISPYFGFGSGAYTVSVAASAIE